MYTISVMIMYKMSTLIFTTCSVTNISILSLLKKLCSLYKKDFQEKKNNNRIQETSCAGTEIHRKLQVNLD